MHPSVLLLARFCKEVGLLHFVGSPGSRSAPILLALSRIGGIEIEMAMDERSAGYVALGKSLALGKPVGIFCTSGTAVLNLGPAVAEAFYQQVPLLLLTADRPPELIDQQEGQAIRQNQVFSAHTVFSGQLPSSESHDHSLLLTGRILNQAWQHLQAAHSGPVHLNIPLREPLYPAAGEVLDFKRIENQKIAVTEVRQKRTLDRYALSEILEAWNAFDRKLLIAGQVRPDPDLRNALKALSLYGQVPLAGDLVHNLSGIDGLVQHADLLPDSFWEHPDVSPDIILTIGNGLISKPLKKFIQKKQHREHWHIQEEGPVADPYGSITKIIRAHPEWMITKLGEGSFFQNRQDLNPYFDFWMNTELKAKSALRTFAKKEDWSDGKATALLYDLLPHKAVLFPGNSMPVRYANWFAAALSTDHIVFANRGTSGIDGCLSAALGIASVLPHRTVVALSGDMGFFYDRNALWRNHIPANLKIMILNNGGGNIFRIIPGSGQMPELEEYFEMKQPYSAQWAAKEAGLPYFRASNSKEMQAALPLWLESTQCAILECHTDRYENAVWVKNLKKWMNQNA